MCTAADAVNVRRQSGLDRAGLRAEAGHELSGPGHSTRLDCGALVRGGKASTIPPGIPRPGHSLSPVRDDCSDVRSLTCAV